MLVVLPTVRRATIDHGGNSQSTRITRSSVIFISLAPGILVQPHGGLAHSLVSLSIDRISIPESHFDFRLIVRSSQLSGLLCAFRHSIAPRLAILQYQ